MSGAIYEPVVGSSGLVVVIEKGDNGNDNHYHTYEGSLTQKDIVDSVDDCENVLQVLRICLEDKEITDFSETAAEIYMNHWQGTLDDVHELWKHDFLSNSDAANNYVQELNFLAREDSMYGTYEDQHRLRLHDVL